ncbi:MAG TPA: hypothetical protein VMM55_07275, partial [Thermohalobaculum sp.]|nr:hypothetical protein [Thermohalobaculum sp.]
MLSMVVRRGPRGSSGCATGVPAQRHELSGLGRAFFKPCNAWRAPNMTMIKNFLHDETGAVTIDWVALTAGIL